MPEDAFFQRGSVGGKALHGEFSAICKAPARWLLQRGGEPENGHAPALHGEGVELGGVVQR